MMIISRKINGRHREFLCSRCHQVINDKCIFDSVCHECGEKLEAESGDSSMCLGAIAWGCIADCKHRKSHTKENCRKFFCDSVGHIVSWFQSLL